MKQILEQLKKVEKSENYRRLRSADSISGYNLSSNDYLGLAGDLPLRGEFLSTLTAANFVPSASSSRLLTGNHAAYEELEALLGSLYGRTALVIGSGYHLNIGLLPCIAGSTTLILADKLVHASLVDGIRLSAARTVRFRHNDYQQLERLLFENSSKYERVVVVTESIFSMDGDTADLCRLCALKSMYSNVWLYVDEAHAVGVRGATGLGMAEELGVVDQIDILVGTFGKALASMGAWVICDYAVREWLVNSMRSLIFSTALPPVNVMWSTFVVRRLAFMGNRRAHLAQLALAMGSETHIVPRVIGDSKATVMEAERLQKEGYFVLPIRPPTVPVGTARLRFSLTADLPMQAIEKLMTIL